MSLPRYQVESTIGYRNPLRHGIRGKTLYALTVEAHDSIEARVTAESKLITMFRGRFGHLEITSLNSRAATLLPPGAGVLDEIVEVRVIS